MVEEPNPVSTSDDGVSITEIAKAALPGICIVPNDLRVALRSTMFGDRILGLLSSIQKYSHSFVSNVLLSIYAQG